jgi:hypothetical protein
MSFKKSGCGREGFGQKLLIAVELEEDIAPGAFKASIDGIIHSPVFLLNILYLGELLTELCRAVGRASILDNMF